MSSEKSKNIIIILLLVIIAILVTLIVLFATDTLSFNIQNNDNKINNNIEESDSDTEINQDSNNITLNYEEIAKEKMPTIISLANQSRGHYVYCGEFAEETNIIVDNIFYNSSKKYKSLKEIKDNLYKTIEEKIVNNYFNNSNYIEQNGKLYCGAATKGVELSYLRNESMINSFNEVTYTITNQKNDSFEVKVEIAFSSIGSDEANNLLTANAKFIKENDNWIISEYEDEITY